MYYQQILPFWGHVVHQQDDSMEKIIQGKVDRQRSHRRCPRQWLDQVEKVTNRTLSQLICGAKSDKMEADSQEHYMTDH